LQSDFDDLDEHDDDDDDDDEDDEHDDEESDDDSEFERSLCFLRQSFFPILYILYLDKNIYFYIFL
jgi:hypothetical protein